MKVVVVLLKQLEETELVAKGPEEHKKGRRTNRQETVEGEK